MIVELPLRPSVGYYRFATPIGDSTYIFDVRWNTTEEAWYVNIHEQDQTPIVYGIKIVLGTYLGRRINHRLFRQGVFVAADTTDEGQDATFDDLGVRVVVRYIPQDDLLVLTR